MRFISRPIADEPDPLPPAGSAAASRDDLADADLERLMAGYQNADEPTVEELVRKLSPMLLRFLAHPRRTRKQNEDTLLECWLRIHGARHTYRTGSPPLPWVFAIARRTRAERMPQA